MPEQASRLCVGLFKQDAENGSVYSALPDVDYSAIKWNATSIIPPKYDFTNINRAGTTVETKEKAFITDLSKITKYGSGKVTPGAISLASVLDFATPSIHSVLRQLAADDPYLCLFLVGAYKSGIGTTSIIYDVIWGSAGILTDDGGASGEANNDFTGSLAFQPSGVPVEGATANGHILTWNTSTDAVTFGTASNG